MKTFDWDLNCNLITFADSIWNAAIWFAIWFENFKILLEQSLHCRQVLTCLLIQNSRVTVSYYLYAMQYLSIDVYGCSWMFLRHGARSGLYPSQQTADEITDSADDWLCFA